MARRLRTALGSHPSGIVVAVSGGADSVALLRVLAEMPCLQGKLVVAHLNHQLRGAESDEDEAFVRDLAGNLNLDFRCERLDVRVLAAGANLEATARRLRYDWLTRVARETGGGWVATGHTADDQAETVLHRLLRGAGLRGLRGIAPRRPLGEGITLIRSLLRVSRSELIAYLTNLGQPFRTDASNADQRFTRNRIRHELLPLLAERYNPGVRHALARLAEQAAEAFVESEVLALRTLAEVELPRAGSSVILDRAALASHSRFLMREVVRCLWEREDWPVDAMSFDHWERIANVVHGEATAAEMPGGLRVSVRGRVVRVGPAS